MTNHLFFFLGFIVSFFQITFASGKVDEKDKLIRAGFSSYLFKDVDKRDAEAELKLWTDELLDNLEVGYSTSTKIYESKEEILEDLSNEKIDLINLSVLEFHEIEKSVKIEPKLIAATNGQPGDHLIIVVQKNSGIKDVDALRKKIVLIPGGIYEDIIDLWLSVRVNMKVEKLNSFFREFRTVKKPTQALLPVFFKQADACIITKSAYLTMMELNPQIKNDLIPIEESVLIPPSIMCVSNKISTEKKNMVITAANSISNSATGRQILSLFRSEGVLNFDSSYLVEIRKMFLKYSTINK